MGQSNRWTISEIFVEQLSVGENVGASNIPSHFPEIRKVFYANRLVIPFCCAFCKFFFS